MTKRKQSCRYAMKISIKLVAKSQVGKSKEISRKKNIVWEISCVSHTVFCSFLTNRIFLVFFVALDEKFPLLCSDEKMKTIERIAPTEEKEVCDK